ncbi:MAG: hypothetical protein ACO2O5_01805 [Candidatus Caldipriscus sp.]
MMIFYGELILAFEPNPTAIKQLHLKDYRLLYQQKHSIHSNIIFIPK